MAVTASRILGSRILAGLVVASPGTSMEDVPASFDIVVGGHPAPTADSERAGRLAAAMAAGLNDDEALIVLLSGGASALMALPADGVTLDDKRRTTELLLRAGADIHALNAVRKHLSAVKGGWLAAQAHGPCRAFAVSDVVGDDLSVIASGPTVADATTFADARAIIDRFGGAQAYPPAVIARLDAGGRGEIAETPKAGDTRLAQAVSSVVGGRRDAMDGAARHAAALGYHVVRIEDPVVGEARTAAPAHLRAVAARSAGEGRPLCIVSSGETTVHVTGTGKGGRNQEFALAAATPLASLGVTAMAASVGTDGIDGPTDAAGALVDSTTLTRAAAGSLEPPARYLDDNNAYAFFEALGDLIHTGPTGTNVGDLQIILVP
jgi:glycerate 2-kinase